MQPPVAQSAPKPSASPSNHMRLARVPGDLWPLAGGQRGGCRVEHGAYGSVDAILGVSEAECQALCRDSRDCLATDYHFTGGPENICDLHKEPVLHVLPMGEHACRIKPRALVKVFLGEAKALNSEVTHLPAPPRGRL